MIKWYDYKLYVGNKPLVLFRVNLATGEGLSYQIASSSASHQTLMKSLLLSCLVFIFSHSFWSKLCPLDIWHLCFCVVGDEVILNQVANLKGSLEIQCSVIHEIIEEAELFKKKLLVENLNLHLARLQQRLSPDSIEDNYVTKKKR